ncbi:tRNA dihydrouridine synthase DusB [Magnetovirga frankeli]|uniref:tRNA dihydrouridine synthase DusB n=1 Tax=Magnetovirga frankeli TaxID=947516 RepID=UPI001292D1AB|nr:tRNA dihydrouridine synthase DusB [gamma proteobacterium SS-5]
MRIGPHCLTNRLILAPMAGVSDKPFRNLCRQQGAGLAVGEMISSNSALRGSRKSLLRLDHSGEQGPIAVQILGADPQAMAEAARINCGEGADIIDINMGCPAKKVCQVAAGSALLRDERLVARILEAVVAAVEVPVTLKIRTGWDPASRNALAIGRIAEQSGIQALSIHGRTRACGFSGQAEYQTIRQVKQALSIPVIANGDIDSGEKALQVLKQTGADGLMIGRAARGRPWIFAQINHFLHTGQPLPAPHPLRVQGLLLGHLERLYELYGSAGVRVARKHIAWYSKGMLGGAELRRQINQSSTCGEQRRLIQVFFQRQLELAA